MSLKQEINETKKEIRDVKKEISNSRFKSFGRSILAGLSKGVSAVAKVFETLVSHVLTLTFPLASLVTGITITAMGLIPPILILPFIVAGMSSIAVGIVGRMAGSAMPDLEEIWSLQELPTDELAENLSDKNYDEWKNRSDNKEHLSELYDKLDNLKDTYKELKNGNLGLDEAERLAIEGPKVEQTKASTLKAQEETFVNEENA